MSIAPNNSLANQALQQGLQGRAPDHQGIRYAFGTIVEVFDHSYFNENDTISPLITQAVNRNPGKLIFGVRISSRKEILPYVAAESDEVIRSAYGNKPLLIGRSVRITYQPGRLSAGTMQILPKKLSSRTNLTQATYVPDIGGIL